MLLTLEQLEDCMPEASDKRRIAFLKPLNNAMEEFEINSPIRIAAFLAQIAVESGSLHYLEEIASGSNYEYRKDLGNLEFEALQIAHQNHSTTGKFYKGRGFIQLTGFYNYKKAGEALELDLIHLPKLLLELDNACRVSAWFWKSHGCNELADVGKFTMISQRINGGKLGHANAHAEREANFIRNKQVFRIGM